MTSLPVLACGSRTPTFRRLPVGEPDYSLADDVLGWLSAIGFGLFDWQRDVLRLGLALDEFGKWAAYEASLVVPRQNGKNEILAALELASIALLGNRLVVHSAHETSTAQKHFQRLQDIAERNAEVRKLLPNTKSMGFYTSNGKEHIRFRNGGIIEFKARTKSSARGFSSDLVVLDEAFDLDPRAVGSMMYTLRARVNPQVWRTSSPAHADSVVLHNDRRRALSDDPDDRRFLYVEWGNDADVDPADPEVWLRSNPSIGEVADGFELELDTFRNEFASAKDSPDLMSEFVREVCGVPDLPLGDGPLGPVPAEVWRSLTDAASTPTDRVRLGFDVSFDRSWASFGLAGRRADGLTHVEVRDSKPGTDWVLERCRELVEGHGCPVSIAKDSPASPFIDTFRAAGIEVDVMSPAEYAEACGRFIDATRGESPSLRHRGDPRIAKSLLSVTAVTAGDGGVKWSRKSSGTDISPLTAVTIAFGRLDQPVGVVSGGFVDLSDFLDDE